MCGGVENRLVLNFLSSDFLVEPSPGFEVNLLLEATRGLSLLNRRFPVTYTGLTHFSSMSGKSPSDTDETPTSLTEPFLRRFPGLPSPGYLVLVP